MKRRDFIKLGATAPFMLGGVPVARAALDSLGRWDTYRFGYSVELPPQPAPARLWLPLPIDEDSTYQRSMGLMWDGNADSAGKATPPGSDVPAFFAEWRKPGPRKLSVSTIVKTLDRKVRVSPAFGKGAVPKDVRQYLQSSSGIPSDGKLKALAAEATKGAKGPFEDARAIYFWVLANAQVDRQVRGVGAGEAMRALGEAKGGAGGADVAALTVALMRASGIPARLAYGVRISESKVSPTLGAYGDVSSGQHCRAEFHLTGGGWIPIDPAAVLLAARAEGVSASQPRFRDLSEKFFGYWEMNWLEFNRGEDVKLPKDPSPQQMANFAYPHAEIAGKLRDSLNPPEFSYRIEVRELVGTGVKL